MTSRSLDCTTRSSPVPAFGATLTRHGLNVTRTAITTVQINLGKRCNQACQHCHVDAGPARTEMMTPATAQRIMTLLDQAPEVTTVDITGGAPELNPVFFELVQHAASLGKHVIDRCNLTVLFEPGQDQTADFLREHQVHIIASLPCYTKDMVERQRGRGVFDKSIQALRMLNQLGYGGDDSRLTLDLVYNPTGPSLPPPQPALEARYRQELRDLFGIRFNHLYTITNMPISRFRHQLERDGQWDAYAQLLHDSFNPAAATGVMCTALLSIAWNGRLYDCDFNQMEDLPLARRPQTLWDIGSFHDLALTPIAFANHCYGCTAGAGSSCQGALA